MAADALYLACKAYLDACQAALEATDAGGIDRRFVSPGVPAWDCCLAGESLVSTESGAVSIRDVRSGDRVWAYEDGHLVLRNVLRSIPRGTQPVYRVSGRRRAVVGTADHPMLRLRPERARTSGGRPQSWREQWVGIGELTKGDVLVSLAGLSEEGTEAVLPDGTPLSEELAWLLGLWTGDGCFDSEDGIVLYVYDDNRERARQIIERVWGVQAHDRHERLQVKSREIYAILSKVLPRARANDKRVPPILWGRSPQVTRGFLDGFAAADGHVDAHGYREYAVSSPMLAAETRMLHIGLGDAVSNLAIRERTGTITIRGRAVQRALPLSRFRFYPGSMRSGSVILDYRGARRALPDERLGIATVSAVEPMGEAETFDLEVEGAHNFIADGLVVHNCPQLSVHAGAAVQADTALLVPALAPLHRIQQDRVVPLAAITAVVLRCAPSIDGNVLPSPSALDQAAQTMLADVWAIWAYVSARKRDGTLFAPDSAELIFDPATPVSIMGGACGWQIPIRVFVPGYKA